MSDKSKLYEVKNLSDMVLKFHDRYQGKDIWLKPNEKVITNCPPEEHPFWKIREMGIETEEPEEKTKKRR